MTGEPGRPGASVLAHRHGNRHVGSARHRLGALARASTGRGTVVDTSLRDRVLGYIGYHLVGYLADGTVPAGQGTVFPMVAPTRSS